MKASTAKELSQELKLRNPKELVELCVRLAAFKKENKELLTYLLFEEADEASYIQSVKAEIDLQFEQVNRKSHYFFKKSIRKILLVTKKFIRYSQKKQTEIELLIYFCTKLKNLRPSIQRHPTLLNIYLRQTTDIRKKVSALHEDLQFDYESEMNELSIS